VTLKVDFIFMIFLFRRWTSWWWRTSRILPWCSDRAKSWTSNYFWLFSCSVQAV